MTTQDRPATAVLEPMVRKLEYRQKLSPQDRTALLALPHRLKTLEQHDYIVWQGDRAEFSCVLLAGFCVRQKIVGNGYRQIVSIQMKGRSSTSRTRCSATPITRCRC